MIEEFYKVLFPASLEEPEEVEYYTVVTCDHCSQEYRFDSEDIECVTENPTGTNMVGENICFECVDHEGFEEDLINSEKERYAEWKK